MQFVPFYRLNEVFFNTFSHLCFILLEDVSINVKKVHTKFAPNQIFRQKENLENDLFSRFFDNRPKAELISWRTEEHDVRL